MKSEFYFQYDESGNPLFYFEFVPEFNYTFFTTSFIGVETELYFERSISYPVACFLEKKEPCKTIFFQFLDMDSQRYIHYVSPIEHDFIASRYLKNRGIDFNLFKSERYIIKKLQTNGVFSGEEYANAVISEYLNRLGKEKFETLMKTKLTRIGKKIFFEETFDKISFASGFTNNQFYSCSIGMYNLYFHQNDLGMYTCWLKQVKFECR
jgi:hypothetical protein